MDEHLYTDHPDLYDAIQSDWDYDRDVCFVQRAISRHGNGGSRLLEIGCGTGEHTRRFVDAGFEVTAVDKYDGMLDLARTKCDAHFRRTELPELAVEGSYDAVVMIRGVVNHLQPKHLDAAMAAVAERVAKHGILVFDNARLPESGNELALDVGTTDQGEYARVAHYAVAGNGTLEWREVVFTADGDCIVNRRLMTPFDDDTVATALADAGFDVTTVDGYGPDDRRTVFVAGR